MKDVFKYTFLSIAEIKKFLFIIVSVSILSLLQAYPVISIVSFLFEKLLFLSAGVLMIYIVKITDNDKEYFATFEKQPFSTFVLHFMPAAMGIMLGGIVVFALFAMFFILILKFTGSMFILANPHEFFLSLSQTAFVAKVLLGFYLVYVMFLSYVFLGKFGEALSKENFKESFLSILSALFDFKFWVGTFNLKYMGIYFVWSLIIGTVYVIVALTYLFYIFPMILGNPDFGLVMIPVLVAITTVLSYFTFFSAYFAYKSVK